MSEKLERWKLIGKELTRHAPFTAFGAVTGFIIMLAIVFTNTPTALSNVLFYSFHPLHVVLSAMVTTAMYRLHRKGSIWLMVLIGYTGSVGIATLSDAIIPYLGGSLLNIQMEFHVPFIETTKMPFIGIEKWIVVNLAAVFGIAIGYWKPTTRFPHAGHVLLSTWASLFDFTAFGVASWVPLLPLLLLFLFLSVWVPCCLSDIVYPLLFVGSKHIHIHG
jgi:hypothetical protein